MREKLGCHSGGGTVRNKNNKMFSDIFLESFPKNFIFFFNFLFFSGERLVILLLLPRVIRLENYLTTSRLPERLHLRVS